MVSGLLVHSAAGVLGSLFPLQCFAFTHVVSVPFCSQIFVPGWFVLRPLRWCSAVSSCSPAFSGLADPFYFSSPVLSFALFLGGSALRVFLLLASGPLGWLLVLSPCPWSSRGFCWSVPTLPSWSVGSPRLAPAFGGTPCSVSWFSHPTFVCCGLVICCLSPV